MNDGPLTFQCACLHWPCKSMASASRWFRSSTTGVREAIGRALRGANRPLFVLFPFVVMGVMTVLPAFAILRPSPRRSGHELPDPAIVRHDVQLVRGILPERGHRAQVPDGPLLEVARLRSVPGERAQP